MNGRALNIAKIVLYLLAVFMAYKVYRVIMEPIEFEKIKEKRYSNVIDKLEKLREAQLAFKTEYNRYADDLDVLISFVDTGKINIVERKDSSFMYFNKVYQTDMNKDTTILRVLGQEPVKNNLFGKEFDAQSLRYIPHSDKVPFDIGAAFVQRQGVKVPVFEIKASNKYIFHDKEREYNLFYDKDYSLIVGSLEEPKVSGNWK